MIKVLFCLSFFGDTVTIKEISEEKKFFKDMFCVFLMCNKINDKCMYYVINRCARFSLKLGTLDKIMSLQVKQS